jgi:hypothetical protein
MSFINSFNTKGPKKGKERSIYKIERIVLEATDQNIDYLETIQKGKLDALIISRFITEEEIEGAMKNIYADPIFKQKTDLPVLNIGDSMQFRGNMTLEDFFSRVKTNEDKINELFGFNILGRYLEIIDLLSRNRPAETPRYNGFGSMIASLKYWIPSGERNFYPHVGNEFYATEIMDKDNFMAQKGNLLDGLSVFLTVNTPDSGGDLRLFDLKWEDRLNKKYISVNRGKRTNELLDHLDYEDLHLHNGDLVIFNGGHIWHTVTNVVGSKPRVTLGGFINYDEESNTALVFS